MIQLDKDGATLIDGAGNRVTVWQPEKYNPLLVIRDSQLQAERENTQTVANYKNLLANIQASVDAGRPHDAAPMKPQQKVVSDTGEVSYVAFVPVLPDLVIPKTTPSGPPVVPTVDKHAIMYSMIQAMFRKMFPEA